MPDWPQIRTVGLSGLLVSFAPKMSEPANRAALAFRAAVEAQEWEEVTETGTSLVSTFLAVNLAATSVEALREKLADLLASRDWFAASLPSGRRLIHVPTLYGTDRAPQLEEAATVAGLDPDEAIRQLSTSRVRVLTIGFAPGQPYMGELPETWDIPRQQGLTPQVPACALVVAIRQLIVFTNPSPTGWRHVGQTAFRTFLPEAREAFALRPGDELTFPAIDRAALERLEAKGEGTNGGAEVEALA